MRKLLIILVLNSFIFLLTGCERSSLNPAPAGNFFPMAVGNSWTYVLGSDTSKDELTITITGTVQKGSFMYFVFESRVNFNPQFGQKEYYRNGPNGDIFMFSNNQDVLYADFRKEPNATWNSFGDHIAKITRKNFREDTPAGGFNNSLEILYDIPQAVDDEFTVRFAPTVGIVSQRAGYGSRMALKSYRLVN